MLSRSFLYPLLADFHMCSCILYQQTFIYVLVSSISRLLYMCLYLLLEVHICSCILYKQTLIYVLVSSSSRLAHMFFKIFPLSTVIVSVKISTLPFPRTPARSEHYIHIRSRRHDLSRLFPHPYQVFQLSTFIGCELGVSACDCSSDSA